jgi:hypothetical protein
LIPLKGKIVFPIKLYETEVCRERSNNPTGREFERERERKKERKRERKKSDLTRE